MNVSLKMYVFCIVLLVQAIAAVDVNMTGLVGLDLKVPDDLLQRAGPAAGAGGLRKPPGLLLLLGPKEEHYASARTTDPCVYKYPKKKHYNALLSDMMNELTKIFTRASEYSSGMGLRARGVGARFRVVSSQHSAYFDGVYANMTIHFKKFYEKASQKAALRASSVRDPCAHQAELRRQWQEMLDASLASVRAAALRCVRLQLEAEGRNHDSKLKNRLGQFLLKEFGRFRAHQLDLLCHQYKLCYKDLLTSGVRSKE